MILIHPLRVDKHLRSIGTACVVNKSIMVSSSTGIQPIGRFLMLVDQWIVLQWDAITYHHSNNDSHTRTLIVNNRNSVVVLADLAVLAVVVLAMLAVVALARPAVYMCIITMLHHRHQLQMVLHVSNVADFSNVLRHLIVLQPHISTLRSK
jgi:hypothetical protein